LVLAQLRVQEVQRRFVEPARELFAGREVGTAVDAAGGGVPERAVPGLRVGDVDQVLVEPGRQVISQPADLGGGSVTKTRVAPASIITPPAPAE
jgi:hypothetical protein